MMSGLFDEFDLKPEKRTQTKELVKKVNNVNKVSKNQKEESIQMAKLFADDAYNIDVGKSELDTILQKLNTENTKESNDEVKKMLKSNKLTLKDKLDVIRVKVLKVLGKQKNNVIVIKNMLDFDNYVTEAIKVGRVAIDTETDNSTDPVTCQIMGLCLYYPGGKQAYIPVNHVNPDTGERLAWQLTEVDCKKELQRILDADTFTIMHNGKFDYEVIYCTCDIKVAPKWDTIIAARLLNENEEAGLKKQYVNKIDPEQEKYDIDSLFIVPYKYVDPDIFALYAATDAFMTDELYLYQKPIFEEPGNEKLYNLFMTIEMPIVVVTAEMELAGVAIDLDFGAKLKVKYENELKDIDTKIDEELVSLKPRIDAWRNEPENSQPSKQFEPKKTKSTREEIEARYPYVDTATNKRFKYGKAKKDQLGDPINLASPVQLGILFYDILGCSSGSKKAPRGTGEEELKYIAEKHPELGICQLLLKRRGVVKLITTYIDVIPTLAKHWPDHRIRFKLNSLGTDTGRYSSGGKFHWLEGDTSVEVSGINCQNIPSHNKEIRMLFKASVLEDRIEPNSDYYELPEITEIETKEGWKYGKDLTLNDYLITEDEVIKIKDIKYNNKTYYIYI